MVTSGEHIDLQGGRLVLGADACIADFHGAFGSRMISSLYSSSLNKSNFVFDNQFFGL
jgi:hypothetical protein